MVQIAKRYAKALFGQSAGNLAKAKQESQSLTALKALFQQKDAGRVLRNPVMPTDLKSELLNYGMTQVGASDDIRRTVNTILASGRIDLFPEVADAFAEYVDEAEGKVRAELTSAAPLKADDVQHIEAALQSLLKKKVETTQSVDSSLLGGFVVKVGNYRIDLSLKAKLDGLASAAVQDSTISL